MAQQLGKDLQLENTVQATPAHRHLSKQLDIFLNPLVSFIVMLCV